MYSQSMKFTESHEWLKVADDNVATIGITAHAQELLGDLVYIELPSIGATVNVGDTVGVVESVKAASDLYAPVTAEIIEVNSKAIADPTLVNTDPHGEGWLFKVKLTDCSQLDKLMSSEQYTSSIGA